MDPFKRSTLLTTQAAMGQITSDEIRTEMQILIPLMQADSESQPVKKDAEPEEPRPPIFKAEY